eukprot:3900840-Rhodomonas_salina.1
MPCPSQVHAGVSLPTSFQNHTIDFTISVDDAVKARLVVKPLTLIVMLRPQVNDASRALFIDALVYDYGANLIATGQSESDGWTCVT